jgi:hypothetical protein
MPRLLDSPVPVVVTVALKGPGLIVGVKARPDIDLLQVTDANRDSLPDELEQRLRDLIKTFSTGRSWGRPPE